MAEALAAFNSLLDTYAVESEHRDVTRLQLLRETLEHKLRTEDDERILEWIRTGAQALR